MNREFAQTVREGAGGRCEYCRIPQSALPLPFQIDHIVAEKHGGQTVPNNTPIGRATVQVLAMNTDDLLLLRLELLKEKKDLFA